MQHVPQAIHHRSRDMTHGVRHGVRLEQLLTRGDVPHGEHPQSFSLRAPLAGGITCVKQRVHDGRGACAQSLYLVYRTKKYQTQPL